jgi:hypothetical protein
MASQLEIRAQIDTETVKALLVANGGGAIALLSILSSILDKEGYESLALAILSGVLILICGLAFAIIHNHLRRRCSLKYESHNMHPPKGKLLGIKLPQPTVCFFSLLFMWSSILAFVISAILVAVVGICSVAQLKDQRAKAQPLVLLESQPSLVSVAER